MVEAVLYDFGGVFTLSPFGAVRKAAEALGIDGDVGLSLCFGPYDEDTDHAWHRLERGELTLAETRSELAALAAAAGHDIDPFSLLAGMGAIEDEQREPMIERALALKATGVKTAVVTNNIKEFGEGWRKMVPVDELFDTVIDSSAVGVRKPDPRIYRMALDALGGVAPADAVLVDDALGNITAAKALGIHGVLVGPDRLAAMDELEALVRQSA
ncbi:MAG: family hydrolase [Acidimicrobiales bacterium]|nr:family hydrolase [Acidimicrobiales bacterium]